jgi:diaminopimelate decarboxylase
MSAIDLVAEHGSPLWLADVDRVRANARAFLTAWESAWPGVVVAYSYKTNRTPPFLEALAEEGILPEVVCEAEYGIARELGADGAGIVVNGPAKSARLLAHSARDGALVIADSAEELDRLAAAGVTRAGIRVAVEGVGVGPTRFGVPAGEVPQAVRRAVRLGLQIEVLSTHLVSMGFTTLPAMAEGLARTVASSWPRPPDSHVQAAGLLAELAARLEAAGAPVETLDLGGGFPPAAEVAPHAAAVARELRSHGFSGRLLLEPGRALVADAVDLVVSVVAVKRLSGGERCVVVDGGTNLVPGALWRWPRVEPLAAGDGPGTPTLVTGPLCLNVDVLHPGAELPPLRPGDLLAVRAVGAYQQSQSTQFGDLRPAIVVRDGGTWRLAVRRETVDDLIAGNISPVKEVP